MTPDDVRALIAYVRERRPAPDEPYDVVVGGGERRADWEQERATKRALAEAGATWWIEWAPPGALDAMRRAIAQGPLRIA